MVPAPFPRHFAALHNGNYMTKNGYVKAFAEIFIALRHNRVFRGSL